MPSEPETNAIKQRLRRHFSRQRQALDPPEWRRRSQSICQHLRQMPEFQQARTVLAFTSFRQEPDLSSLYTADAPIEQRWGFPRCVGKTLAWHEYPSLRAHLEDAGWQTGRFGLREPAIDWPLVEVGKADLILVPAIACDRAGGRLGYGGGFYDRLLAQPEVREVVTIGIIFSFAHCEALPLQAWDQPLDFVCSDLGVFTASSNPSSPSI